jgi:hypothetical protein
MDKREMQRQAAELQKNHLLAALFKERAAALHEHWETSGTLDAREKAHAGITQLRRFEESLYARLNEILAAAESE